MWNVGYSVGSVLLPIQWEEEEEEEEDSLPPLSLRENSTSLAFYVKVSTILLCQKSGKGDVDFEGGGGGGKK